MLRSISKLQHNNKKYKQLKSVINYVTTNKCLHHIMMDYFGQMSKNKCFMCSNCNKKSRC